MIEISTGLLLGIGAAMAGAALAFGIATFLLRRQLKELGTLPDLNKKLRAREVQLAMMRTTSDQRRERIRQLLEELDGAQPRCLRRIFQPARDAGHAAQPAQALEGRASYMLFRVVLRRLDQGRGRGLEAVRGGGVEAPRRVFKCGRRRPRERVGAPLPRRRVVRCASQ